MKKIEIKFSDAFFLCLDNNSSLWNTKLDEVEISSVDEIRNYPDADIVISSIYEKDILELLSEYSL